MTAETTLLSPAPLFYVLRVVYVTAQHRCAFSRINVARFPLRRLLRILCCSRGGKRVIAVSRRRQLAPQLRFELVRGGSDELAPLSLTRKLQ